MAKIYTGEERECVSSTHGKIPTQIHWLPLPLANFTVTLTNEFFFFINLDHVDCRLQLEGQGQMVCYIQMGSRGGDYQEIINPFGFKNTLFFRVSETEDVIFQSYELEMIPRNTICMAFNN